MSDFRGWEEGALSVRRKAAFLERAIENNVVPAPKRLENRLDSSCVDADVI